MRTSGVSKDLYQPNLLVWHSELGCKILPSEMLYNGKSAQCSYCQARETVNDRIFTRSLSYRKNQGWETRSNA